MSKVQAVINKVHRVCAGFLLLSMVPAAYASFTGDRAHPSFWVYLPLLFLFPLIITGTYQLVLPWVRKYRSRRAAQGPAS